MDKTDLINDGLNDLDIGQFEVVYNRKIDTAQWEKVDATLRVTAQARPGQGGDDISAALRNLSIRTENELALVRQRSDLYKRLFARLLKLNVTADDAPQALDALGIAWPVQLVDLLAACQRVETIKGIEDLPLNGKWVWWRTGKGPDPRLGLPKTDTEGDHPDLDTEMTQARIAQAQARSGESE